MLPQGNLLLWALALGLVLMLVRGISRLATATHSVHTRRRVRRNYGRVASRTRRRPAVMLSVKTADA
jgi:hypothetical protein